MPNHIQFFTCDYENKIFEKYLSDFKNKVFFKFMFFIIHDFYAYI